MSDFRTALAIELTHRLIEGAKHYEKSAPTVAEWADDLYQRIGDKRADHVTLSELLLASRLMEEGVWMHPNTAANNVYKLNYRLGRDTTGHAGF